eukprot:8084700-Alexandrium_andersonii.AAC.1
MASSLWPCAAASTMRSSVTLLRPLACWLCSPAYRVGDAECLPSRLPRCLRRLLNAAAGQRTMIYGGWEVAPAK